MEIIFRQLQRLTVSELQNYIHDGDAIVTVNAQPKFVLSNYPRCKEGIGCSLTNALVAPQIDTQAGMLVSPPNSPDKRYHPITLATKDDVILAKLDEVSTETKEQGQIVDKLAAKETAKPEISHDKIIGTFKSERSACDRQGLVSQLSALKKWLAFAKAQGKESPSQWDRALVNAHMQSMEAERLKAQTRKNGYEVIRLAFQIAKVPWPMPRRAVPKVDRSRQFAPTLELAQVKMMIDAAKDGTLNNEETSHEKAGLLQKYASNLSDDRYRNHYVSYARAFLNSADALDKESINRYLARLKRQGKKMGTVNFAFRVIRTLFNVNKLDWPFRRGEVPLIGQRDEYKPALDPELIRIMVEAARNGRLEGAPACFLALSTVYALRREEMCDLQPGDVDLKANTIFISTVKSGRERYHLIPKEIKPYLEAHDFSQRYSLTQMSQLFWVAINRSGLETLRPKRLGWHCIRHTVKTLLDKSGLDPFTVHSFMRWKGVEREFVIDVRYHASHFVGLEGTTLVTKEAESDKEIFDHHPLLEFWR